MRFIVVLDKTMRRWFVYDTVFNERVEISRQTYFTDKSIAESKAARLNSAQALVNSEDGKDE